MDPGAVAGSSSKRVRPSATDHSGLPMASYFHDSKGFTSVSHSHE